jgi:hypothetical protein
MGEIASRHSCYANYLQFIRIVGICKMCWLLMRPRSKWKNDIDMNLTGLRDGVT